jgi:SpoIIAA-like
MIEILPGFPGDVVAFSASGELTEDDYRKVLVPAVDEKLKGYRTVRLFFHLGPQFKGFTAGAMWQDAKLGISRWSHWGRIAIVTDVSWMTQAVRLFRPLFHDLRIFHNAEYDAARVWICEVETRARAA